MGRAAMENQVYEMQMMAAAYHDPKLLKKYLPLGRTDEQRPDAPGKLARLAKLSRGGKK